MKRSGRSRTAIRDKEAAGAFDAEFIALARSVYVTNDRRAEAKREINRALKSRLVEEKSYKPCSAAARPAARNRRLLRGFTQLRNRNPPNSWA